MQSTHLILVMLNFSLPVTILLLVLLLSSSSFTSAAIEMRDQGMVLNERDVGLYIRQYPPTTVNMTVCTQQNWSGYCQTLTGSPSTCSKHITRTVLFKQIS